MKGTFNRHFLATLTLLDLTLHAVTSYSDCTVNHFKVCEMLMDIDFYFVTIEHTCMCQNLINICENLLLYKVCSYFVL